MTACKIHLSLVNTSQVLTKLASLPATIKGIFATGGTVNPMLIALYNIGLTIIIDFEKVLTWCVHLVTFSSHLFENSSSLEQRSSWSCYLDGSKVVAAMICFCFPPAGGACRTTKEDISLVFFSSCGCWRYSDASIRKFGPKSCGAAAAQLWSLSAANGNSSLLYSSRTLDLRMADIWKLALVRKDSAVSTASPTWSMVTLGWSSLTTSNN